MTAPRRAAAWEAAGSGIRLHVRLTPKSSRDAVEGMIDTADGPALKARVRAVPEDGAANAALEQLVAKWLGVQRSSVAVAGGHKSRLKTLLVSGNAADLATAVAACAARLQSAPGES